MGKAGKKGGKAPADPRFSSSLYDPRFIVPSLKKNKIKVDDRFSKEELKKLNVTATGKKVKVDRYGRKLKDDAEEVYDKYFEEEKEEEAQAESGSESGAESGSEADSESGSDSETEDTEGKVIQKVQKKKAELQSDNEESEEEESESEEEGFVDRARGEGLQSDSSDDSDESDSFGFESDSEIEVEEEKPEEGDPSHTFAVVNLDWDNVRAVDLMATFASFVPKGGLIKSVSIYPSEFGKEQMQKEEVEGPPKDLFKTKKKQVESDSDSDEELDLQNQEDLEKAARKLYEEDDGAEDYDSKALRRYQLQRLRYYYAVVRCDSIGTAKNIYDNCDGSEYESTANIFDLRYVPEGMNFDDEAKDICTKIPSSYRPDSAFVTDALQHSKVKLTWDETPKERMTLSSRLFSQKEIDDMDFKAYLASDSESSEGEQAALLKDKYKNLLGGKFSFDKGGEEEDDVDMEITFNPGLDQNKPEEPEKKAEEESTIAAYKRKEKERRNRRMEKFKTKEDEEKAIAKEAKQAKKNKKGKKMGHEDDKSKAELELLMLDENDDEKNSAEHFSMRDIVKAEKQKNKKNKKGKKSYDNELVQTDFQADLNDPRFKEVFESHEYAIDPTNSEFKKTETMKGFLKERSKRQRKEGKYEGEKSKKQKKAAEPASSLNNLVEKLKQKSKH